MPALTRICALALSLLALGSGSAGAATFIRDAEIEHTLHRIADPILRVAMLSPGTVNLYIVGDPRMNAFVAGGQNIFINSGMLTQLDTIEQLQAVIAHEAGHIAGGHLQRMSDGMQGPRNLALLGLVAAAAATVGGNPQAGMALAAGGQQMAQRSALAYSRGEEASADSAAVGFLSAAGGDPGAMVAVLQRFEGQEALMTAQMNPYLQNHPLSPERIAMLEQRIAKLPKGHNPPSSEDIYWYDRMVAKLKGFLQTPTQTLRDYPPADGSEFATLARAVAYYRQPDVARGSAEIEQLLALRPDDPYYLELKGQFLLESGHAAPAVEAYRRAVELAPGEPLLLGELGRALLNTDDRGDTAEARDVLARSAALDKASPDVLRDLALAEARLGNEGAAALDTAERFLLLGKFRDALRNADHASAVLPYGSPGWRRAQDVTSIVQRALKKERP